MTKITCDACGREIKDHTNWSQIFKFTAKFDIFILGQYVTRVFNLELCRDCRPDSEQSLKEKLTFMNPVLNSNLETNNNVDT